MSDFEKAWNLVKEDEHGEFCDCSYCHIPVIDEGDKWSREYDEAYSRGDQETMDRMNAENEADETSLEERRALAGNRDYDQHSRNNRNMMRLMPFWIHFREKGFTDEQIENLTLKQIEDFLNEE